MERYSYQKVLGTGNYGKAWLVQSRESNRYYVVKEINVSCMSDKDREQAVNEVAILGRLKHVNIIRYREAFVSGAGGVLAIVMEYADGGDLAEKIEKNKASGDTFSATQILNWFVQLCLALHYMHSQKILHRDLKPSNLFLTSKGLVKVGDFGIAKMLHHTLDHASTAIGTPYYLSPEICKRHPYNQKSDMWAAGCILYELTTLNHPFDGPDFSTLILRILHGVYTPIARSYGMLLDELITVLLSVAPEMRPSAQSILTAPNMRPHVKAYTDLPGEVEGSRSQSTSATPRIRDDGTRRTNNAPRSTESRAPSSTVPRTAELRSPSTTVGTRTRVLRPPSSTVPRTHSAKPIDNGIDKVVSSLYVKSPLPQRRSKGSLSKRYSIPSSDRIKSSEVNKDKCATRAVDQQKQQNALRVSDSSKRGPIHRHSISEPVQTSIHTTLPSPPSVSRKRPKREMSKPTISHKVRTVPEGYVRSHQICFVQSCRGECGIGHQCNLSGCTSDTVSGKAPSKRRSCTPAIDMQGVASPNDNVINSSQNHDLVPRKRRRSLPERVKDSKFLARLVSSERKTSVKLQPKVSFPAKITPSSRSHESQKSEELTVGSARKLRPFRPSSAPSSIRRTGRKNHSPVERSQQKGRNSPESVSPTRRIAKPRGVSKVPITCLFPQTPAKSSKSRSLVKHGTYTLNLPSFSANFPHASPKKMPKCERCGCNQGIAGNSKLVATNNSRESSSQDEGRDEARIERSGSERVSSTMKTNLVQDTLPRGNFSRRNAIRRPSRDYGQKPELSKRKPVLSDIPTKNNNAGHIPDIIPSVDGVQPPTDELSPIFQDKNFLKCENTREPRQLLEVSEFLHAGMPKDGEITSDLRGKLELLRMYLERRIGADRTLVAYDIMASAAEEKASDGVETKHREVSVAGSEEVVRLVSDVLGPGKMIYFPILVQTFNLNNRCS